MTGWIAKVAAVGGLVWLLAARMLGPCDLWDQAQPLTVGYTTDMLVNGNWLLPRARGTEPATKPPLYNWLAAPAVGVIGFESELAHKLPSVLALIGCVVMVIAIGQRRSISPEDAPGATQQPEGCCVCSTQTDDQHTARCAMLYGTPGHVGGWLAALMLVSNYALFKLGYLARPDMLLVFLLLAAWWSATRLLTSTSSMKCRGLSDEGAKSTHRAVSRAPRGLRPKAASDHGTRPRAASDHGTLRIVFWLSIAAAGLTKGPVAVLPLVFVVIGGRVFAGSWRAGFARLGWWWGLPLVLLVNGAWIVAVWQIDAAHLRDTMWAEEILGRVTGTGSEGARQGPIELLTGLLDMPAYFLIRFAPWSVIAVIAMIAAVRRWRRALKATRPTAAAPAVDHGTLSWRMSATIFVLVVLIVTSMSAGKRADYIAPAYPMAALLAAWWLEDVMARLKVERRVAVPIAVTIIASITLGALTQVNRAEPNAPHPQFSEGIEHFIQQTADEIEARPAAVRFCWTGETHAQALLGESHETGRDAVFGELQHVRPFWVVAGLKTSEPHDLASWMAMRDDPVRLTPVVQSIELPRDRGWPVQMTLYWLEPVGEE